MIALGGAVRQGAVRGFNPTALRNTPTATTRTTATYAQNRVNREAGYSASKVTSHQELLSNSRGLKEGDVGKFKELNNLRNKGDNITAHHIPSRSFMEKQGVKESEGISFAMQDMGRGQGRHGKTRTYGGKNNAIKDETPREALARDIKDLRTIYREENLYTPEIKEGVKKVITENKQHFPNIFEKNNK